MIIQTKLPVRGDGVIGNINTKEVIFIKNDPFESASEIDQTVYEIIGTVVGRVGKDVLINYKNNANKVWSKRYSFKLTGYTLDGTDRTGILSIRSASDSWAANVQYTISYNATTAAELVEQLNTYFAATSPFTTQDWYAEADDEDVISLTFNYTSWQQANYNKGESGFSLSGNLLPGCEALANMLRKHGGTGGEGAISSWYRALTYFRQDQSSTTYNPNSTVTSIKRSYPVTLPAYLGTSTHRSGDFCALLRQTYGEGEAGWLKFMESCRPVVPTDFGNMGMTDGLARTKYLAEQRYNSLTVTDGVLCPAADYCYNISTVCIPKGNWFLGTTRDINELLLDITYPSHGDRASDAINKMLQKLGGTAISNGSSLWSCCRYNAYIAWLAHGYGGFFYTYHMYDSLGSVPLTLYRLA